MVVAVTACWKWLVRRTIRGMERANARRALQTCRGRTSAMDARAKTDTIDLLLVMARRRQQSWGPTRSKRSCAVCSLGGSWCWLPSCRVMTSLGKTVTRSADSVTRSELHVFSERSAAASDTFALGSKLSASEVESVACRGVSYAQRFRGDGAFTLIEKGNCVVTGL